MKFDRGKVIFTFDDGTASLYVAFNLFMLYNILATFYIITGKMGNDNLTWEQVKEMSDKGMDIQCHTHSHTPITSMTEFQLIEEIEAVNRSFKDHNIPEPRHTAYPYGHFNDKIIEFIRSSRDSARTATYKDDITRISDKLSLSAYQIDNLNMKGMLKLKSKLNDIARSKFAIILFAHGIGNTNSSVRYEQLKNIVNFVKSRNLDIITISELSKLMN